MSETRQGCCADQRQPCAYHEGWQDCLDTLEQQQGTKLRDVIIDILDTQIMHPYDTDSHAIADAILQVIPNDLYRWAKDDENHHPATCPCNICQGQRMLDTANNTHPSTVDL